MSPTRSLLLSLLLFNVLFSSFGFVVRRECSAESRDPQTECTTELNYVCAHFTGGNCDSDICQKLAVNECHACKDPSVQYFTAGICQSDKIYCEDNTRDLIPAPCAEKDVNDVCAYYTEGCLDGECALRTAFECNVCRDPTVTYYRPGGCTADIVVQTCDDSCYDQSRPPICLFKPDCEGDDCAQTYTDKCVGCSEYPDSKYKNGPCEKDRITCGPDSSTANCENAGNDPVCAYFKNFEYDEGWSLHQTTVANACTACKDITVSYYTQGECHMNPNDMQVFCLPSHNPLECPDIEEPVCGYPAYDAPDNYPNGCAACSDKKVTYHRPGVCSYECPTYDSLNEDIVNCNGSLVEPICAYIRVWDNYDENSENSEINIDVDEGQVSEEGSGDWQARRLLTMGNIEVIDGITYRTVSIKNPCVACFDLYPSLEVSFYRKGFCQGDQGIRCDNEATSYYYGIFSPVCGLSTEECSDSSCRTTFTEPLAACSFSSSVLYTPGYCPGDQGISCDLYRSQFDEVCDGMDSYTIPVCGYSRAGCEDDSCRTTYDNQCYACSDRSVVFFTGGACGAN